MRQKIFIKQTCRALLLYFICLTIAVAIDLIFFKVKNMYHTPALVSSCPSSSLPLVTLS